MKHVLSTLALAAAAMAAATAQAAPSTNYRAVEVGPLESPPNASPGWGITEVDIAGDKLLIDGRFTDLMSNVTEAHIHCCTTTAFTGDTGIAVPLMGVPTGVKASSWKETVDLTKDSSFDPTFLSSHGGTASSAMMALTTAMNAHEAYVNIHTTGNPNGEIRGWLVAAPIPEPATWAMLGVGLAGLGFMARRRVG